MAQVADDETSAEGLEEWEFRLSSPALFPTFAEVGDVLQLNFASLFIPGLLGDISLSKSCVSSVEWEVSKLLKEKKLNAELL